MYLKEEYLFFRLSYDLVNNHDFTVIDLQKSKTEIWLEKTIGSDTQIIRLLHQSFDWANHLKEDVASVIYRVQHSRKVLPRKKVFIYNVYISTYSPVDSWEMLKKPMKVKDKRPTEIQVYYLDEEYKQGEKQRLYKNLGLKEPDISYPSSEIEMEQASNYLKDRLAAAFHNHKQETAAVFKQGKPFIIYFLLVTNLILFYFLEQNGGSLNTATLIAFGAKYNAAILAGEWWRIITSMFLHIGFLHLAMNMLALYYVGGAVERIYGSWRFMSIYLLAGIIGGLSSFAFNAHVSAGASGALFGLFGALLYFGFVYKKLFFQTMGWNLLFVIGLNIVFGFTVPQIDNGAHLGGLLGGSVAAALVSLPKKKKPLTQVLAFLLYTSLIGVLVYHGMAGTFQQSKAMLQVQLASESVQSGDYEQVLEITKDGLKKPGDYEAELLFFRSLAHLELGNTQQAITDLEKTITINPDFPEAHYNLALLYDNQGNVEKAVKAAGRAFELNPENPEFENLYQRLAENG